MKRWMAAAAGFALLASAAAANAQNAPASTNSNADKTTQMNRAPSSESAKPRRHVLILKHRPNHRTAMRHRSTTTGAGSSRVGPVGGPQNDPSIHQSIQRDSRGTPKGPGSDYNK